MKSQGKTTAFWADERRGTSKCFRKSEIVLGLLSEEDGEGESCAKGLL